ncbi:hypothetical protein PP175_04015 [Aneurinibacillus sp. Ricciae_BoGa-3]|uniref:hypothetical protein n=1 Tax=Aneurinibacillus sp. Ricciae_BoGa-3 TaxID=3022697 RepID=UPI002341DA40|nr:hypothetical protein [Aneurinibacillus sp. Ricciae_BoGa-3]WCK55161.1 hypothetical protein PP175_04015 [Aneurinibacillus sp. Ricciae_BoGa-3]
MATITAHALIGQTHPYDGGVTNVSHQMSLTENSVARWTLSRIGDTKNAIRWMPNPQSMLEDGLLMIGLFVVAEPELVAEAERLLGPLNELEMMPSDSNILQVLHSRNRQLKPDIKVAFAIYEGSSLMGQYPVLEHYSGWDAEVCVSKMRRENSRNS